MHLDNSPWFFRDFTSYENQAFNHSPPLRSHSLRLRFSRSRKQSFRRRTAAIPGANTAEGQNALLSLTTGTFNTAVGFFALKSNDLGNYNTAIGAGALVANSDSVMNTAVGAATLLANIADGNTATGAGALLSNFSGFANTANGESALSRNTTGSFNTASGGDALFSNSTGGFNTANGFDALTHNIGGSNNTAVGVGALHNSTGSSSIGIGFNAGEFVGSSNNVIAIGNPGDDVDNTTWIGNIYGVSTQSGTTAQVIVSDSGQLGTVASSERFKKDIAAMEDASEAILSLRPVTFHYKSDCNETPQFGLIAEEVAKVNPALVLPDQDGKTVHGALRRGERDVAQRVSQRTPQSRGTEISDGAAAKGFRGGHRSAAENNRGSCRALE